MSLNAYVVKSTSPERVDYCIRLLGANGADPTKEIGEGVTVTRTGEGAYTVTWSESPGTFLGALGNIAAATPGNCAGYTVIFDTYASLALPLVVYNSSFAAADIIADEYLYLQISFKRVGATG